MSVSPSADLSGSPNPAGDAFENCENDPDCIRFLLASDNHIGFLEKDPVRGQDSINTFKEILDLAKENDVDFILLGGDLFHENKPSRLTLHQVIALLREHTMGDRPISVELRSDAGRGYKEGYSFPSVNYADENINVGIPVFSIHGNHDDPQGSGAGGSLSALDILSAAGLITYFGRTDLPSDDATAGAPATRTAAADEAEPGIRLKPILLQKGETKLALYGLGNIRDERLHFELRGNRVRLQRPVEETEEWFNLLVLHQNRAKHNLKNAVPEGLFDDSTHLVIWGHEHECRIIPEMVSGKPYSISQPGSSVATSLSAGETVEKQVAIVMVKGQDYRLDPIRLKTVRPFLMDEIDLEKELEKLGIKSDDKDRITKVLRERVTKLIGIANKNWDTEHADDDPQPARMLPLIRLRVIYTNQVVGNPVRFGQEFAGRVANPKEILQFHKKKEAITAEQREAGEVIELDDRDIVAAERLERVQIGTLMKQILLQQNMQLLNPRQIQDAVLNYAEKDNKDALTDSMHTYLTHMQRVFSGVKDERELYGKLEEVRRQNHQAHDSDQEGNNDDRGDDRGQGSSRQPAQSTSKQAVASSSRQRGQRAASDDSALQEMDVDDEGEDDEEQARPSPRKGKGKAAPSASAKKAARPAASRANRNAVEDDEDEAIEDEEPAPKKSRASALSQLGGVKAKKAPAKAPAKKAVATSKAASASASGGMRQSQLSFGAEGSGRGRTAAKKAQSRISHSIHDDDDDDEDDEIADDDDEDDGQSYVPPARAASGGRDASGGGKGKSKSAAIEIEDSDEELEDAPPPKKRATATSGRRR
ncbi:hypothetical protein V8E36_001449 [Tilletia maclaganii]